MLNDFIHKTLRTPYTLNIERLSSPRRPRATIVLIHGIGSSTHMWHTLAPEIRDDVRVLAVDLLGFGNSPYPEWAKYDAHTQARSLLKTLIVHRVPLGSIFVGHSLGALVVVELAKMVPRYVSHLVLVSPPIYRPIGEKTSYTQRESLLRGIYKILQKYPKNTERALKIAKQYYIRKSGQSAMPGINITSYLQTLESAISNQNTIEHISYVKAPITILSGSRDPVIVHKNLRTLNDNTEGITYRVIKGGGHNVIGKMRMALIDEIKRITP